MNKIVVQKFGGSSVGDLDKIRAVARRVVHKRNQGYDLVVVVSAMGDTTDELLEMAQSIAKSPSRRELDMLLSVGERISMALLSMAIHHHGFEAISLTGSQCGIITTDSHSNARIMDVRPFRVQDELTKGKIVIVAGYQGTSYRREVTTLGRGGSDTTAVALAAALGAEACEIYSDVDGVFSADPRVVLDAHQLLSLSYDEMMEMARSGASVLNEQAVEFAKRSNIALYARSAHQADSVGTVIRPDGFHERARRAESGLPQVAVSHLCGGLYVQASESSDSIMSMLGDHEAVICDWAPGTDCVLFFNTENTQLDPLAISGLGHDVVARTAGIVSLVGDGIGGKPQWVLKAHQTLAAQNIPLLSVHTSRLRISIILNTEDASRAAQALHAAFV